LHEISLSTVTDAGAPRPGWKLTFQEPSTVASSVSTTLGKVREVSFVGVRNTTNTVPRAPGAVAPWCGHRRYGKRRAPSCPSPDARVPAPSRLRGRLRPPSRRGLCDYPRSK